MQATLSADSFRQVPTPTLDQLLDALEGVGQALATADCDCELAIIEPRSVSTRTPAAISKPPRASWTPSSDVARWPWRRETCPTLNTSPQTHSKGHRRGGGR